MPHDHPPVAEEMCLFRDHHPGVRPGHQSFEVFGQAGVGRAGLHQIQIAADEPVEGKKFICFSGLEPSMPLLSVRSSRSENRCQRGRPREGNDSGPWADCGVFLARGQIICRFRPGDLICSLSAAISNHHARAGCFSLHRCRADGPLHGLVAGSAADLDRVSCDLFAFMGLGQTFGTLFIILGIFILDFSYFVYFELRWAGQSPGKRRFGIRVISTRGTQLRFTDVLIRNLMRPIDMLPFAMLMGGCTCLIDHWHRRLGDLVADTIIIRDVKKALPSGDGK